MSLQLTPPHLPPNTDELPNWVYMELNKLHEVINFLLAKNQLYPLAAEPEKVWDGLVVLADGTNWNPGSGRGVYYYDSSSWNYIG